MPKIPIIINKFFVKNTMFLKTLTSCFILLFTITHLFSMEITKGKKYKTKDGKIVTIVGTSKEVLNINNLIELGCMVTTPKIFRYFIACVKKSNKLDFFHENIQAVCYGEEKILKRCLNEEYHGPFYYAIEEKLDQDLCVNPTELDSEINND